MLADALGRPLRFIVTAGQVGDITQAPALLDGQTGRAVLADKAYDSNALRRSSRQAAQPHRTLLLPAQTLPPLRHSIRQANRTLRRLHQARSSHDMDAMNVDRF